MLLLDWAFWLLLVLVLGSVLALFLGFAIISPWIPSRFGGRQKPSEFRLRDWFFAYLFPALWIGSIIYLLFEWLA